MQVYDGRLPINYGSRKRCISRTGMADIAMASSPLLDRRSGFHPKSSQASFPYLFRYSYLKTYGEAPFGNLAQGADGIREDLRFLFGVDRDSAVLPFARLVAMKKRQANNRVCPCGNGRRPRRCHNLLVNRLRDRLNRIGFGLSSSSCFALPL